MIVLKQWLWNPVELSLVQILVLVANIQMKTLKAEVEKGFTWSLMRREWPSPKRSLKWFERVFIHIAWKGNRLIFLWYCHDVLRWRSITGWRRRRPWEEFSFLFNKMYGNGIGLSWDISICLAKQLTFSAVRCVLDDPWKAEGLCATMRLLYS